jgi:preprotein translocase subunit SecD
MQKNLRWKIIMIVLLMLICLYFFVSPKPAKEGEPRNPLLSRLNLGLDLQGGIHLVLRVVTDDALNQELLQDSQRITQELKTKNISFDSSKKGNGYSVELAGIDPAKESEVRSYLDSAYNRKYTLRSSISEGKTNFSLALTASWIKETRESTVRQALETIRRRVDQYGVSEPNLQIYGGASKDVADQIIVELPGVDDPERVKDLIKDTAQLQLCLVKKENGGPFATIEGAVQANGGSIPDEYQVIEDREDRTDRNVIQYRVVSKVPVITGKDLKTARRGNDKNGNPAVNFYLTSDGAKPFSRATGDHIGEYLAVVLDNQIVSAPVINSQIDSDGIIEGRFTIQQAEDLSLKLRSGALPARLQIDQDQRVGASLGNDSIRSGILASIIGFCLVVITMIVYYKHSGLNAIYCLIGNLIILLGFMGAVGGTLTLPGIAGIILVVGMAVDSNILIFERIREELRMGKTIRAAVDTGFSKVFWTILDTHVTTLVSAMFLFTFGTGPIKGFAVTLTVGLLANMFTAVYVSHRLFEMMMGNRRVEALSI